jgi:hypothetical protein
VPPPFPGMLINHITGNRKSLYQLKQVCCKPDTDEITQEITRTFVGPCKTIAFQVGVELAQRSKGPRPRAVQPVCPQTSRASLSGPKRAAYA